MSLCSKPCANFASGEVAPYIKEWDEKSHFERSVFDKMADLGLLGVCIPEQYGGAGFDYISLGLVCEELEACDTFLRVMMSVHVGLNSLSFSTWGTEEQKQKYLVPQAKGEKLATFGLTEPNAGSDVVGMRSNAQARRRRLDFERRENVDFAWAMLPTIFCSSAGRTRKNAKNATIRE